MKITFNCYVTARLTGGSDKALDTAQLRAAGLDGFEETEDVEIAPYIDDELIADEGLIDAGVRYWLDDHGDLRATLSFRSIPNLSKEQIGAMARSLQSQLMDGWGSGRIIEGITPEVWIDWFDCKGERVSDFEIKQIDDGEPIEDRRTPTIVKAANKGDVAALRAALDAGADINGHGRWKMTALMICARDKHEACVDLLLNRGAAANPEPGSGFASTALGLACTSGHAGIVRKLLAAGADPSLGDKPALHWAVNRDHGEVARILLEAGADMTALDDAGETALFLTSSPSMVNLLLAAGMDAKITNAKGQTALEAAIEQADFNKSIDWREGEKEWRATAKELKRWMR